MVVTGLELDQAHAVRRIERIRNGHGGLEVPKSMAQYTVAALCEGARL